MTDEPTLIGLFLGLGLAALYLLAHWRLGNPANLPDVAILVLASVGAVVGSYLMRATLGVSEILIANLGDQRVPVCIGALAITWISVVQIYKIFANLRPSTSGGEEPGYSPGDPRPPPSGPGPGP